jgi:hypothetical protein
MGGRVGAGLNHRECSAPPEALGTRIVAVGGIRQPEGSSRRARSIVGDRESGRRGFVRRRRRDLGPSRAQADGFAQTGEELRFTIVVPPAPAATQLEEMRASALGESAPFLRDLVECMGRQPCRHGEAVVGRSLRPDGRVVGGTQKQRRTDNGLCQDCTPESRENHNPFRARARGKAVRNALRHGESLAGAATGWPKN